jgi:hypothetical protein
VLTGGALDLNLANPEENAPPVARRQPEQPDQIASALTIAR